MGDPLRDLLEALSAEDKCYRGLVGLAEEQKAILVSGKLEGLQDNVRRQEKILFELGPVSSGRQLLLGEMGKSLGLKSAVTMTAVIDRISDDRRAQLERATRALRQTVRELESLNLTNGKLLENAQAYSKFTLEAMRGSAVVLPGNPAQVKVQRTDNEGRFNQVV